MIFSSSGEGHRLARDSAEHAAFAGCTAQECNQRKGWQRAFWEDRYHATAIETDEHLHRCLVYIDLNMVRDGVNAHPHRWSVMSSYNAARIAPPNRDQQNVIDV
jgi:putative transposase